MTRFKSKLNSIEDVNSEVHNYITGEERLYTSILE